MILPRDRRPPGRRGEMQEPQIKQIKWLFCKRIRKPDVVKPGGTGETEPTARELAFPVCRGQCGHKSSPETAEMCVVLLITQRPRAEQPKEHHRSGFLLRSGGGRCVPRRCPRTAVNSR